MTKYHEEIIAIPVEFAFTRCPKCEREFATLLYLGHQDYWTQIARYCYMCGADMDLKADMEEQE